MLLVTRRCHGHLWDGIDFQWNHSRMNKEKMIYYLDDEKVEGTIGSIDVFVFDYLVDAEIVNNHDDVRLYSVHSTHH